MNKLFIIGNGFDLSLGLKTKYEDFIFWLVKREMKRAHDSLSDKDKSNNNLFTAKFSYSIQDADNKLFNIEDISKIKRLISNSPELFKIEFHDPEGLFYKIYSQSSKKWVDIELEYYSLLKYYAIEVSEILKNPDPRNTKHRRVIDHANEKIQKLNHELKVLGEYLDEYLKEVSTLEIEQNVIEKHQAKFSSNAELTYFLNFNYTNTLNKVLTNFGNNYKINHIHGSIDEGNIIFGYGDEMDKSYKAIEELNDNTFFEHIKSFRYFKQENYSNLLSFLSSGKFQVCIYGHSCGLSDRVMLNEIFEHENCESIEVYYYNEDEYTTKTMDISRHFNSNQLMRQRIQFFKPENRIPQVDDKQ